MLNQRLPCRLLPRSLRPASCSPKEAVLCPSPTCCSSGLQAIHKLVTLLSSGLALPPSIMPYLCSTTLLASNKKDGGIRLIAVGDVLRRLVSKCLARTITREAMDILSPPQVGVGIHGGVEAAVHAMRFIQESTHIHPSCKVTLLLDFSNAFNSILSLYLM